jgi:hypothetical protein
MRTKDLLLNFLAHLNKLGGLQGGLVLMMPRMLMMAWQASLLMMQS